MITSKKLRLCVVLLAPSVVLAQAERPVERADRVATLEDGYAGAVRPRLIDPPALSGDGRIVTGLRGRGPGDECPEGYLCGQNRGGNTWLYSDTTFESHPYGTGRVTCESFPPPGEPNLTEDIGLVDWHGAYIDEQCNYCLKDHYFEIRFYPNINVGGVDQPDVLNPVGVYVVVPEARPWGVILIYIQGGWYYIDVWRFAAYLDPPLLMPSGWLSIASIEEAQPPCHTLLAPAGEGDGHCWRYWMDSPTEGKLYNADVHYCLRPDEGACCYPDGTCEILGRDECEGDNYCPGDLNCDGFINFSDINPFVLRLSDEAAYYQAYPNCHPLNGDCNGDDVVNFDDINPFVQILSRDSPADCPSLGRGGIWLGVGRVCDECCYADCPPEGDPEGEPECFNGYVDDFNGGCDAPTPAFSPIAAGQTICGTSGTYVTEGELRGDSDWYEITTTGDSQFRLHLEATFAATLAVLSGPCDDLTTWASTAGNVCKPIELETECLPPGTWWFRVAPTPGKCVPCGRPYLLTLDCDDQCEICDITCPEPNYQEQEPCGEDLNGSCPDALESIDCDTWICGTLWADAGGQDEDWYLLDLSENAAELTITLNTELPVNLWLMVEDDCNTGYATAFQPCLEATANIPDECRYGPAYIMIRPETDANELVTEGYPCGYRNEYYFKIDCDTEACDCHDELTNSGFPPEGEPVCSDEYIDTYNGGCDAEAPAFLPLNYDYWVWLAQSGKYNVGGQEVDETDWWEVDTSDWGVEGNHYRYKLQFQGEESVHIEFYDASEGCPGTLLEIHNIRACEIKSITTQCRPRGKYWFRVNLSGPCGVYYIIMVDEFIHCQP